MPREPLQSTIRCYRCDSDETRKNGFASGRQRYYCRSCRRTSFESPTGRTSVKSGPDWRAGSLPSQSRLILELRAISQRLGRTPTSIDIRKLSKEGRAFSIHKYYRQFGSFPEAVKKAGLKSRYPLEFDHEKLLGELRALRKKLKRPLFEKDVAAARKKGSLSSLYHFEKVFGSVSKALAAAGAGRKKYSRQEMIELLRRIDAAQDRPVTGTDIDKWYHSGRGPSHRSFEKEFGGIARARLAAGVLNVYRKEMGATRRWQKYTIEELTLQLQALGKNLGRKPTDRDINRASRKGLCASATTIVRVFGSLPEAYRKAGFENIKPRTYTDREILTALKKLVREKGAMPTAREIVAASKEGRCPAPGTIIKRFGKLSDLREKFNF